jgi:hypothetical protein
VLLAVVWLAMPAHVWAQPVVCSAILPGETAARAAARITGAADNRHEAWFQILDPATKQFIEKSRYERIHAGWQACIVDSEAANHSGAVVQRAGALEGIAGGADEVALWIGLALAIVLVGSGVHDYMNGRTAPLQRFAERFVHEFARPLVRMRPAEPVVEARLRVRPYRAQVEVLLAPHAGHSYPNLVDHKENVEYDVERVLRVLEDRRVTHGPLYAQGRWVVVPLHLQVNPKEAGGT